MQPKIIVKKWKKRGREVWVVRYREAGQVRHSFFESRTAAESEASRLRGEVNRTGQVWNSLTAPERESVISAWRAAQLGVANPKVTLQDAIKELVTLKKESGKSDRYTANLKTILDQFAVGRSSRPVAEITVDDVEAFLRSKLIESRATLRSRLSTLFKFAIRRGYRLDNPCARLEAITAPHKPPAVFSVDEACKCLEFLSKPQKPHKHSRTVDYRYGLPWFVLSTFCGLRPEEADKTRRADIHAKEGWIKIEAQTTKVRQRRVCYPLPQAMALLKSSLKRGRLPISQQARKRLIRKLRNHLGWKRWPKDVTRHSAASYWLAECGSAATVAEMLGHSESTLKRHYKALVTKQQASQFWKLTL